MARIYSMRKVQVDLTVSLPEDLVEDLQRRVKEDPEWMSMVVLYALTRRNIVDHLRADPGHED